MFKWFKKHKDKNYLHGKSAGMFSADKDGNIKLTKIGNGPLYNIDHSLAILIRDWLRKFAANTISYPAAFVEGKEESQYKDLKEWTDELLKIAKLFDDYTLSYFLLDDTDEGNKIIDIFVSEYDALEIKDEFMDKLEKNSPGSARDLKMCYIQSERIKRAMNWLGEHWGQLWD